MKLSFLMITRPVSSTTNSTAKKNKGKKNYNESNENYSLFMIINTLHDNKTNLLLQIYFRDGKVI